MTNDSLEIPEALRGLAQLNGTQAKQAFDQFMVTARQAQNIAATTPAPTPATVKEIQKRSAEFTEQNSEAAFAFASELAKARTLDEWRAVQQRHAQLQIETYTQQAKELGYQRKRGARSASPPNNSRMPVA